MGIKVKVHIEDIEEDIPTKQSEPVFRIMNAVSSDFLNMVITINGKNATKDSLASDGDVIEVIVPAKAVKTEE